MLQAPSPPRSSVDESIGDGEKIGDERAPTLAVQLRAAAQATGKLLFEQTQEHAPTYPRTHAPYSTLPYPTIPLLLNMVARLQCPSQMYAQSHTRARSNLSTS